MFQWLITIPALIGLLLLIGIPFWIHKSRKKRKKYNAAFSGREPLEAVTFYEEYFQSRGIPADVVIRVKRVLEGVLNDDLSLLRAEDDFKGNLGLFFQYDSMAPVEIVLCLEAEFKIKITDSEAGDAHTIDDIVNLVWKKLRQRAA